MEKKSQPCQKLPSDEWFEAVNESAQKAINKMKDDERFENHYKLDNYFSKIGKLSPAEQNEYYELAIQAIDKGLAKAAVSKLLVIDLNQVYQICDAAMPVDHVYDYYSELIERYQDLSKCLKVMRDKIQMNGEENQLQSIERTSIKLSCRAASMIIYYKNYKDEEYQRSPNYIKEASELNFEKSTGIEADYPDFFREFNKKPLRTINEKTSYLKHNDSKSSQGRKIKHCILAAEYMEKNNLDNYGAVQLLLSAMLEEYQEIWDVPYG